MQHKNVKRFGALGIFISCLVLYNVSLVTEYPTRLMPRKVSGNLEDNLDQLSAILQEAQNIIDTLKNDRLNRGDNITASTNPSVLETTKLTSPWPIEDIRSPDWSSLFKNNQDIKIWIDVPNDFPWRKCLLDYNGKAATSECTLKKHKASSWRIVTDKDYLQVVNLEKKKCLEPESQIPKQSPNHLVIKDCSKGRWKYTGDSQLSWTGGGCLTALGPNSGNAVSLNPCDPNLEEQKIEFGKLEEQNGTTRLAPLNLNNWIYRQQVFRDKNLVTSKAIVLEALNYEIKTVRPETKRRAVVFYLDKGTGFLNYLNWWILAWKLLGLNSATERFDLVLFTHPDSISHIPKECSPYSSNFDLSGAGVCFYVSLYGISYRDSTFDKYLNSHECLVSVNSSFLEQYSHILRSDMDTFPTPQMVGFWPERLLANKYMGYTFRNSSGISKITEGLKETAKSLGFEHKGWFDIGSSWFGDAHRVIKLSKLTVALSKYLKYFMFGPGTHCRCATCHKLPDDCQWAGGPYAGTLLLYAQELAMNVHWTQEEYDSMVKGYLDHGTTTVESVCEMLHLHIFHNAEPFSKFRFGDGLYKTLNITGTDVSLVRHYAMYLALRSSNQGVGVESVTAQFNLTHDGSMANMCKGKDYGITP